MRTYLGTVFSCLYVTSQVSWSTRVQPTRLPSGATSTDGRKRDRERKLNYSTKIFEGVPIIVKDGEYSEAGKLRGNNEWPVTLPPRLLRDGFAIQPTKTHNLPEVTKTEYSTFTYFITSLQGGETVTSTDIVVSSNIVTSHPGIEATPTMPNWQNEQISSTPIVGPPRGFHLLATKTYFTTSTFFTTYIDREKTITKTRTNIRSKVVTESYSGGQFDYLPGPVEPTLAPTIQESPKEKYLSLGPNIYGLVKTFYATYTYNNGIAGESREVITQVSTSLFSATDLPASISVSKPYAAIASTASLQLDQDTLLSLKQSFINQQGLTTDLQPSLTATYVQSSANGPAVQSSLAPTPSLGWDNTYLSSLKESFQSQLSTSSLETTQPDNRPVTNEPIIDNVKPKPVQTDVNLPTGGNTIVRPTSSKTKTRTRTSIRPSSTYRPATQPTITPKPKPAKPTKPPKPTKPISDTTPDTAATNKPPQSQSASDGSESPSQSVQDSNNSSDDDASENTAGDESSGTSDAITGGLLGAVVGGISSALIPQSPPGGLHVDLGPVLDAVATLLRGPIRSAIANRRNTGLLSKRNDASSIQPTKTLNLPQFARIPSSDPNVIPVGGYGKSRYIQASRDPQYGFIPLNAPQKYRGQAIPRSDTELEAEDNFNDIQSPQSPYDIPKDILNILEESNHQLDQPIVIDKDKIVINNHIVRTNDPHIIDVLNKYEHSYLYNKPVEDELRIRIASGQPMPKPKQKPYNQRVQPSNQNSFFGIPLPKLNLGGNNRKPQPSKKRPPPYTNPGQSHQQDYRKPQINTIKPQSGERPKLPKPIPTKNSGNRRPVGPPSKNKPNYAAPGGKRPTNIKRPQNVYNRGPPPNTENRVKPTKPLRRPDGRPPKPYQNNVNPYEQTQPSYNKKPNSNQIPHGQNITPAPNQISSNEWDTYPRPKPQVSSQNPQGSYLKPRPNNDPRQPINGQRHQTSQKVPNNESPGTSPKYSVIDTSINQIPGSNQWNTYGPGQLPNSPQEYGDNRNVGQGQIREQENPQDKQNTGFAPNPTISSASQTPQLQNLIPSTDNNLYLEDSMSSVSEQSKVVMPAPPGMIEDDTRGSVLAPPKTVIHQGQRKTEGIDKPIPNPGSNSQYKSEFGPSLDTPENYQFQDSGNLPISNRVKQNPAEGSKSVSINGQANQPFGFKVRPKVPLPSGPPPRRKPSTIRRPYPAVPRPRPSKNPFVSENRRKDALNKKPPRPYGRPNQVAIDVPAFPPQENAVRDPFGQVISTQISPLGENIPKEPYVPPPTATPSYYINPNKARKKSSTRVELSASIIQGDNQIIGSGFGIVIGSPTDGYMKDVTITGSDGRVAVIQTKQEGVPEIDPSFTVSAGYPAYTEVYTINPTASPSFTLVSKSKGKFEYEGWLTDGDPLKDLPPLRPTVSSSLDFTIVETEAPKTVTYQNEWQTPSNAPTADFVPYRPPPPESNFEREWKTYKKGEVETVDIIRPTSSARFTIQETEAPKTVTYENEWFANTASQSPSVENGSPANGVYQPVTTPEPKFSNNNKNVNPQDSASYTGEKVNSQDKIQGANQWNTYSETETEETNANLVRQDNTARQENSIRQDNRNRQNNYNRQRKKAKPNTQDNNGGQYVFNGQDNYNDLNTKDNTNRLENSIRLDNSNRQEDSNKRYEFDGKYNSEDQNRNQFSGGSVSIPNIDQLDVSTQINPSQNDANIDSDLAQGEQYTTLEPLIETHPSKPNYPPYHRPPKRPPITTSDEMPGPVGSVEQAFISNEAKSTQPTYVDDTSSIIASGISGQDAGGPKTAPNTYRPIKPTAEIINGDVRVPPRPPPTYEIYTEPQTYDPFAEYQDTYPELVNVNGYPEVKPDNYEIIEARPETNQVFGGQPGAYPVIGKPPKNGNVQDGNNGYPTPDSNNYPFGVQETPNIDTSKNIEVTSDGYSGFNEINVVYPVKDQNSDGYNDQFISEEGSGLAVENTEHPQFKTTSDAANNGYVEHPEDANGYPNNSTYHSSEYVNEIRYPPRYDYQDPTEKPSETNYNNENENMIDGFPNKSEETSITNSENVKANYFTPTRGTFTKDQEDKVKEDGRKSSVKGEIDLSNFFDTLTGNGKPKKKRKYETSTRNTFSTRGKPTFINIDSTQVLSSKEEDENTGQGSVIVTNPIEKTDQSEITLIDPIRTTEVNRYNSQSTTSAVSLQKENSTVRLSAYPYPKRRPVVSYKNEDEIKDNEVLNDNVGAAIVEQVPGNILSAEDLDPETKCQNLCGENEMCAIGENRATKCRCRPGFGKRTNLPDSKCEKSKMYQIEVLTTSESQETRIVRFNPQAVQQALENSFEDNIKDFYHSSEITSIKVSNNTKRNFALDNDNVGREANENMKIKLLVELTDNGGSDGPAEEERIRSLIEPTIKNTKFPLGSDVMVSRVSIDDFDECASKEYNDCSEKANCLNTKGSYNCTCMPGYLDLKSSRLLPGRICSGASTECELCNRNGQCVLANTDVSCNCNPWFAGKNCQINLKLLLIVGAVSVCLMMIIACGVSCFCCRDRRKKAIPIPYGVSMARLPPNVRQHSLMMDPTGTVKSAMSGRSRQKNKRQAPHPNLQNRSSNQGSIGRPWQDSFGSVTSRGSAAPSAVSSRAPSSRPQKPTLVIPRAKVTPSRGYSGYHSDDDRLSSPVERNRAMSEVASLASRHRRRSVPSFASGLLGGRGRREGSVDPLLEGFQSDGGDSGGRQSNSTFHRSVSRGDLDAMDRAETRSVARSYNETIIRPVTRRLQSAAGTSYRSNRSTRTSEDGRIMAEKDGGSSFVVSPRQQLYRLQDSDGSFESL